MNCREHVPDCIYFVVSAVPRGLTHPPYPLPSGYSHERGDRSEKRSRDMDEHVRTSASSRWQRPWCRSTACLWVFAAATAFGAQNQPRIDPAAIELPELRLHASKLPDHDVKVAEKPRLAAFLVDCSHSMHDGFNGGQPKAGNRQRWELVREGIESTLKQLQKASPGIEVRIRFFATTVDCMAEIRGRLDKPEDVDHLLINVPKTPPEMGVTHLFEAITRSVSKIREENKQRQFEWVLFGVFSDGEDRTSPPNFKTEYLAQLESLRKEVPAFEKLVWTVGNDAQLAAGKGDYGPLQVKEVGSLIPVPPKPRARYAVSLAQGQPAVVAIDQVAAQGGYRLPVSVVVEGNALLADLRGAVTLGPNSPFAITERQLSFDKDGKAAVLLQVPPTTDVDRGVSVSLSLDMAGGPAGQADVSGTPTVTFTFKADKTLPPDQWTVTHGLAVRRGEKTVFSANPGVATDPHWTFRSQVDPKLTKQEKGLAAVASFDRAGPWDVEFSCTSETGRSYTKKADPIEVVDADFAISVESASVAAGAGTKAKILPAQAADSKADYSAAVDGHPVPVTDRVISIAPELLPQIGRHTLSVSAKTAAGGFTWQHDSAIEVTVAPRIGVIPTHFIEGQERISFDVKVSGDVGDKVAVFLDGVKIGDYPVAYPNAVLPIQQLAVSLPADRVKGREAMVEVRPAKESACPPDKAAIQGAAADIYAQLKQPTDGASITTDADTMIVLEPAGDHKHGVGDVEFVVAFTQGDAKPREDGPRASRANAWKVALPSSRYKTGQLDVWAKPVNGRLRPEIFPAGKDYRRIGTLKVSPPSVDFMKVDGVNADDMTATPGKPLALKVAGVDLGRVESIRWRYGPLLLDTELSTEKVKEGTADDAAILITTPKAWGSLPVELTVKLRDGAVLEPVKKSVAVTGISPLATPTVTPRSVVIGAKSVRYKPALTGDYRTAVAKLFVKGGKPDAVPLWESAAMHGDPGELHVDLPQVSFERVKQGLELKLAIDGYPGDPNPWHEAAPVLVPVYPKPLWHWWLLSVAPLVASCFPIWKWLSRNEPLNWVIEYSFQKPMEDERFPQETRPFYLSDAAPSLPEGCRCTKQVERWRRSPRHKRADVPLWVFARDEGDDRGLRWLLDPKYGDFQLIITNWPNNPFENLDRVNTRGNAFFGVLDWERASSPNTDSVDPLSQGYKICPADTERQPKADPLYIRMRCPQDGVKFFGIHEHWIRYTWIAAVAIAALLLLIPFHCWFI